MATDVRADRDLPAARLAGILLLMGFGYALLSVCLFRLLTFTLSSTAFFVLYVAVAMPLGAYMAHRYTAARAGALRASVRSLLWLAFLLPLIGWLATRGQSMTSDLNGFVNPEFQVAVFWRQLAYQLLVVSPFFAAWGFAEFVGYQAAIRSNSRWLRDGFYLIFVWALACAVAVGFWAIPSWGLLRTVALALLAALFARRLLSPRPSPWRRRFVSCLLAALVWIVAGALETPFVRYLFSDTPYNVGAVLSRKILPWGSQGPGETALISSQWGKYSHVSLAEYTRAGKSTVVGAYDGVIYWLAFPQRERAEALFRAVFDLVPDQADVAILGAGGGRQVAYALDRNARSVVAVDIIPEVFTMLRGEHAWVNAHIYQSPLVETVAADGRSYLKRSDRQFDLILVPHTESWAAIVRGLFEAGQRIHTVEAFDIIRAHLKPTGIVATVKAVDMNGQLFNAYAASMRQAGLHVIGWIKPQQGLHPFVLLASPSARALDLAPETQTFFAAGGFRFVDFRGTALSAEPIYDDSPWVRGVLGTMIQPSRLRQVLGGIGAIAILGLIGVGAWSVRHREPGEGVTRRLLFVLAGVATGVHAVYLQNAVIFWLIVNLLNPLASFFLGTALFLLAWGLSSAMLKRWNVLLLLGVAGIVAMLQSGGWQGQGSLVALVCIALGSGLCFPLLGLTFQSRLLHLFVADALGGFVGGLLGIWLPVVFGLRLYFDVLPWVSLATLGLLAVTVGIRRRPIERDEPGLASANGVARGIEAVRPGEHVEPPMSPRASV